jgi:hypothetical protein
MLQGAFEDNAMSQRKPLSGRPSKSMNMRRISAKFVPRLLIGDQKTQCVSVWRELNTPETTLTSSLVS